MVDNNFITNIKIKANLQNDSAVPINQMFLTQSRLRTIDFNGNEMLKIIRALNTYKADGHNDMSIRMTQVGNRTLIKPLIILCQNSVKYSYYPDILQKSIIIPVHKKVINN